MAIDASFNCDLAARGEPFDHFWEHTVGSGHATLALRADWQAQMRRAHDELGFRHVRFHAPGDELQVDGGDDTVDAWLVRGDGGATMLMSNFALPRHPIEPKKVPLTLANAAAAKTARIRRIDADHANPRRRWLEMGSPEYPNPAAVEELYGASAMPSVENAFRRDGSTLLVEVALPPLAVAAVEIGFGDGARH